MAKTRTACRFWITLVLAGSIAQPSLLHAEAAGHGGYRALVEEGYREYRLHNLVEARSLLLRAKAMHASAMLLRTLGMVEFELHHYRDSAVAFDAALSSEPKLDRRHRRDAERMLRRAENFLTHVSVLAQPWPSSVRVDGAPVQLGPGDELVLDVGDHVLEFAQPGHLDERRQLRAVGGESLIMRISMLPITVTPFEITPALALHREPQLALVFDPQPTQRVDAPHRSRKLWWVSTVLIASAVLATGVGFALSRREREDGAPLSSQPIAVKRGP